MKRHQIDKAKGVNKSKFTLKKNMNYLPQMLLQKQTSSVKSSQGFSFRMMEQKNQTHGTIDLSNLDIFYKQMQNIHSDIATHAVNFRGYARQHKSKDNSNRLSLKNKHQFKSLRDKGVTHYKTQNNSLIKATNDIIVPNKKQSLRLKDKQLQLKISINNYNKLKQSKTVTSNPQKNQLVHTTKYVPTSFITFNTQPSSTVNNRSSFQTLHINFNDKKSIEIDGMNNTKKLKDIQIENKGKNDQETKDFIAQTHTHTQSNSSHDDKEVSDALEYDEVKDIIIYHDFSNINLEDDYLFSAKEYDLFHSKRKEVYLKYFIVDKEATLPRCSNSKGIPIVKFII